MNFVFSKDGFRRLMVAWILLGLSILAAAGLGWGSLAYLRTERHDSLSTRNQLSEAQSRVEAAKRERDDLKASAALYAGLVQRGILQEENRLDFIERMARLKARHNLFGLEYEVAPQRPLTLAGGRVFNAVDVQGSRVTLRVQALHEGHALAFLHDLATPPRGFTPVSRCALRQQVTGSAETAGPRVQAECTAEWITLKDKRGNRAN